MSDVIAYIRPSLARRVIGASMLGLLGLIVTYVALWQPPALGWQLFLLGMGAGALFLTVRLWHATGVSLELTREELRDSTGRHIVSVAQIDSVSRGVFAFKPSNGFMIILKESGPRAWAPGLWWRVGRRIGIGGVTSGHEARNFADILMMMLADRDGLLEK